ARPSPESRRSTRRSRHRRPPPSARSRRPATTSDSDRRMNRFLPHALMAPAVGALFLWMIVPLAMTVYFSLIRYNLMQPEVSGFAGLANYEFFVTDPSFATAVGNTLPPLGSVRALTA